MARAARQRRENELPYIPFGPFQIRFPFIHYKIESVEFIQGLILGVTALAAVPYLEQYLGLPYELAWSCVIISIFGVGIPPVSMFVKALPLALVCYVIAFGDFVTTETLVTEARQSRDDEYIDFNSSRSNLVSGIRNLILSVIAPFPPLSGPLWVGMTVSVSIRYKEGKKAMKSLIGGMASFRIATFLSVLIIPVVSFFRPIFGVGSSITLMFQAFVCARIGMDYCRTDRDKMIAGVMAAVLATQGTAWASAWALAVGFGLNIFLSNWDPRKKEENAIEDKN